MERRIQLSDELEGRLTELKDLMNTKSGAMRYKTMEDLIVDLIDDVVDVWIDHWRHDTSHKL